MMLRQRYTRRHEVAPFCIMFQTNNPGAWSEIGADPWVKNIVQGVHDPVCDAATAGDPGPTYQNV